MNAPHHNLLVIKGGPESGAVFSPCGTWRYLLWRCWSEIGHGLPRVAFVGLNPSTADESVDDPTIRRCIGFAKRWGFGGLTMLNAYAFRATDPADMKRARDPVGPGHDEFLKHAAKAVDAIVAAWGVHCEPYRAAKVCQLLDRSIECLGKTKDGKPKHPLYLRGDAARIPYWSPAVGGNS